MKSSSKLLYIALGLVCLLAIIGIWSWWRIMKYTPYRNLEEAVRIYVYPRNSWEDVVDSLASRTETGHSRELKFLLSLRSPDSPHPGSYLVEPGATAFDLYKKLTRGQQSPVRITFRSVRLPEQVYSELGKQLMIDSLDIAKSMADSLHLRSLGVDPQDFVYRLLPNTYEVYWTISPESLVERLAKESEKFWTQERIDRATALGLSVDEVITLASIVQEESAMTDEYPEIAGLYLNRLRIGMPLQADPTVKFAVGDFGLRRILHSHLEVDSPYNTYLHAGLPPGPIRIPNISALKGVLDAADHGYLYMCAKEDFSGYHNFARTYSEHLVNARRYAKALNERNIRLVWR